LLLRQENNILAVVQTIDVPIFKEGVGANKINLTTIRGRLRDYTRNDGAESREVSLTFYESLSIPATVIARGTVVVVVGHVQHNAFMRKNGTYAEDMNIIVEGWFPRLTDPYGFLDALRAKYPRGVPQDQIK
jgi:hypothetical protein